LASQKAIREEFMQEKSDKKQRDIKKRDLSPEFSQKLKKKPRERGELLPRTTGLSSRGKLTVHA